jgi:hypothetical protein
MVGFLKKIDDHILAVGNRWQAYGAYFGVWAVAVSIVTIALHWARPFFPTGWGWPEATVLAIAAICVLSVVGSITLIAWRYFNTSSISSTERIKPAHLLALGQRGQEQQFRVRRVVDLLLERVVQQLGAKALLAVISERPKGERNKPPQNDKTRTDAVRGMNKWLAEIKSKASTLPFSENYDMNVRIFSANANDELKALSADQLGGMNAFEFGEYYLKVAECDAAQKQADHMVRMLEKTDLELLPQFINLGGLGRR